MTVVPQSPATRPWRPIGSFSPKESAFSLFTVLSSTKPRYSSSIIPLITNPRSFLCLFLYFSSKLHLTHQPQPHCLVCNFSCNFDRWFYLITYICQLLQIPLHNWPIPRWNGEFLMFAASCEKLITVVVALVLCLDPPNLVSVLQFSFSPL